MGLYESISNSQKTALLDARVKEAEKRSNMSFEEFKNKIYDIFEQYEEAMLDDDTDVFSGTEDSYANEMLDQHLQEFLFYNFKLYKDILYGQEEYIINSYFNSKDFDNALKSVYCYIGRNAIKRSMHEAELSAFSKDAQREVKNNGIKYYVILVKDKDGKASEDSRYRTKRAAQNRLDDLSNQLKDGPYDVYMRVVTRAKGTDGSMEDFYEAEMQSLFDIVTDDARKNYNYIHYSAREIDEQDKINLVKDIKQKGGDEVRPNVYALDDFIYDINNGITVSENTDKEYKVEPIEETAKSKDYLDDVMLNEFTDDYYKWGEDDHKWTKAEMKYWIIGHKEDNPDTTIDLIHLNNLLNFQHDLYKQDKEDGMFEESESSNTIEYVTPNYTGGGIYVYTGKLSDGTYFMSTDDAFDKDNKMFSVRIVNENPDEAVDENNEDLAWFPDWQEEHLVKDLNEEEAKIFTKQILNWITTNKPEGNYDIGDIEKMLYIIDNE